MDAQNADNPEWPAWRPTWLKLLIWLAILFAIAGCILWIAEDLALLMLVDLVAAASVVGFWWVRAPRGAVATLLMLLLGLPACIIGFWICILLEVNAIASALYAWPPPRPMFANVFRGAEMTFLPSWHGNEEINDRKGNLSWFDFADNVVLIYIDSVNAGGWIEPLRSGVRQSKLRLDDENDDGVAIIPRTRDKVIVVLSSGEMRNFALPTGQAAAFYEATRKNPNPDLRRDPGSILEPAERTRYLEFVRPAPASERDQKPPSSHSCGTN
ncbi:MAG: hypothetical protein K2Y37_02335 [Pirellulales bacterium]|nr:hypothetical protein [Pirellulales bacterium]